MTTIAWKVQASKGFSFSYPLNWKIAELPAAGEGYSLFMPGQTSGTNIVVVRNPHVLDALGTLEKKLVAELQNTPQAMSSKVTKVSRIELAGQEATCVHFRAMSKAYKRWAEGIQVGTLLSNGQGLVFTLAVFDGVDKNLVLRIFEQILESVVIDTIVA
jgi:hypothetical protein